MRILVCILLHLALVAPIQAQKFELESLFQGSTNRPPAMRSVFWNTVLGSIWGATVGVTLIDSTEPTHKKAIGGASIGGIIGYSIGLILVIQGITFDPTFLPSIRLVESQNPINSQPTYLTQVEWNVFHQKF